MNNRTKSLTFDYLRDLIVDIKCAKRDGLTSYAMKCEIEFNKLWKQRHNTKIDRYGAPYAN